MNNTDQLMALADELDKGARISVKVTTDLMKRGAATIRALAAKPERPEGGVVGESDGWWNDAEDIFTWPVQVGDWGARIECHGNTPEDAKALAQSVVAALATPPSAPAVGEVWHSVSDELPAVTGWYIGFWMGRVEPLQWRGEYWHHTRPTRDIATPSHWMQMPTPPTTPQPGGEVG
jgi:hypothetical protein